MGFLLLSSAAYSLALLKSCFLFLLLYVIFRVVTHFGLLLKC
jgi:hypothetical protein